MTNVGLFWTKAQRADNGCLRWTATSLRNGYGQFTITTPGQQGGKKVLAHRFAFEAAVRPLVDGERVDHMCHNVDPACPGGFACLHRLCIEPSHLNATTQRANLLGSAHTLPAQYAAREACANGHLFTPENTRMRGNTRVCRACERDRQAKRRRAS